MIHLPAVATFLLLIPGIQAGTPSCAALSGEDAARATALMATTYLHDGCDLLLSECLAQSPRYALADRMAENICRRVALGQDDETVQRALTQRAWAMLPTAANATFDLDNAPTAGDPSAPVRVVVYASPRGPNCARMIPGVYDAVTSGPLRGKVQLAVRLFPLRSNPLDKETGLALLAAQPTGHFWDLALHSYAHPTDFTLEALLSRVAALGLDPADQSRQAADPAVLERLQASKKEGVENGVDSTPTFFIDGRLYRGELEVPELLDVLEEVWDQTTGHVYAEGAP